MLSTNNAIQPNIAPINFCYVSAKLQMLYEMEILNVYILKNIC